MRSMGNFLITACVTSLLSCGTPGHSMAEEAGSACEVSFCTPCEECHVSVYGELLVLKPCEPTAWATITDASSVERLQVVEHDWTPGLRVGFLWDTPCAGWSVETSYLYYEAEGRQSVTNSGGATLRTFVGGGTAAISSVLNEIDFHQLDVMLQHYCCLGDGLELVPYAGFRGVWIYRDLTETSSGLSFSLAGDGGRLNADYSGFGVSVGSFFSFCAMENLSYFGRFGGALVVGPDDFSLTATQAAAVVDEIYSELDCHNLMAIDAEIGFERRFCCGPCEADLSLSYFNTTYLNLKNPVVRVISMASEPENCLVNQGVNLHLGFSF